LTGAVESFPRADLLSIYRQTAEDCTHALPFEYLYNYYFDLLIIMRAFTFAFASLAALATAQNCGPKYNNAVCAAGKCCSQYGWVRLLPALLFLPI
jgi:hypothetical protein